jgi:subtilase family serine protease
VSGNRRAVALAVAAITLGGTGLAQVAGASPATHWVSTATKALTLHDVKLLDAPAAARPLHISLALAPRDSSAVARAVKATYTQGSSSYHRFITPAQWNARFAPTATAVSKVTSYLRHAGFAHISVTSNRLLVSADASVARVEQAFHTTLGSALINGVRRFLNVTPALVPSSLGGAVQAVLGLNDIPLSHAKLSLVKAAGPPALEAGLYPKQFNTTYHSAGTHNGSKTAVAVMTEGDISGTITSLRYAEHKEHAPRVPVTVVPVGPQSPDTSGADEFDMDSQVSTMVPGSVKRLYMYNIGSLVDTNIVAGVNSFVAQNQARALSASLGGCDLTAYLDGAMVANDITLQEAALQGQTFFASSGDNGAGCAFVAATGVPSGFPEANWPCSGEYTVCVGGTSLIADAKGNRIAELGWVGSGGGFSVAANPGFWTQDSDPLYEANVVTGGRAVPDISLDGDPNVATPVKVYVGKTLSFVGGTSLSSPMMLGFWARLESGHRNLLGFASPGLYGLYDAVNPGTSVTTPEVAITVVVPTLVPKPVPGLTDIVLGDNGPYPDLPGYDEVTGLGAPDVAALNHVLKTPHLESKHTRPHPARRTVR